MKSCKRERLIDGKQDNAVASKANFFKLTVLKSNHVNWKLPQKSKKMLGSVFTAKVANMNEVVTPGRPTLLEARKRVEEATYAEFHIRTIDSCCNAA